MTNTMNTLQLHTVCGMVLEGKNKYMRSVVLSAFLC